MRAIGVLIAPNGEEWFDRYGPMTKDRNKALVFASPEVAHKAAMNRFGRGRIAFWDCELEHELRSKSKFQGWTNRVIKVA
jgi:hypothetical protein